MVVGQSGGGKVAWGVADARPGRVSRVVFVETVPQASGFGISEFEVVDGVFPFPGWDFFPAKDVSDLDDDTRARTVPLTFEVPGLVQTDPARYEVPVTLLVGSMDRGTVEAVLDQ